MSYKRMEWIDVVMENPKGMVAAGIVAILLGFCIVFLTPLANQPLPIEEAVAYEGEFEKYSESKNDSTICFTDGTEYDVDPHTLPSEFRDSMEKLEKGTKLYLLINPNTSYAVEVRTDTKELLNFESSQTEMADDQKGYVFIGGFILLAGIFFIVHGIFLARHRKTEKAKESQKHLVSKVPLRPASDKKARILLEAQKGEYNICYRRVGRVNELIINGEVWDEYVAAIEFEHCLSAVVDGNKIEAGHSEDNYSYISFNGHWIKEKKRWI